MGKGKLHKTCLTAKEQGDFDLLFFATGHLERRALEKAIDEAWPKIPIPLQATVSAQIVALLQAVIQHNT